MGIFWIIDNQFLALLHNDLDHLKFNRQVHHISIKVSGNMGTCSQLAMLHRLQHYTACNTKVHAKSKMATRGPKMADGSWKGV